MSDEPIIELNEAGIRALASHEILHVIEAEKQLFAEHASAFRWLTASLLAVNGGSALALFSSTINPATKIFSGAAFFAGIFCALLCSYFSQGAAVRVMLPLRKLKYYWISVEQSGELVSEKQDIFLKKLWAASRTGWPTRIAGWLSAIAFCAGVLWIGLAVWSDATRCVQSMQSLRRLTTQPAVTDSITK